MAWVACRVTASSVLSSSLSTYANTRVAVPAAAAAALATTSTTLSALCVARRRKSYHFFMNLDDPEATQRRVEEELERLACDNRKDTTAYLHSLLNLALSHYQRGDFISARDIANYTHTKALARNPKSSMLYFTATTCAQCADALARDYEAHVQNVEAQRRVSAALCPTPSVVFGAQRAIKKLRVDAERYRGIAHRVYNRPDMAFMRGGGGGADGGNSDGRWRSSARHRAGRDTRSTWAEDSSNNSVDEEGRSHVYGVAWQERRKRPEHAEMKHYYKQQCGPSPTSVDQVRWNVPK